MFKTEVYQRILIGTFIVLFLIGIKCINTFKSSEVSTDNINSEYSELGEKDLSQTDELKNIIADNPKDFATQLQNIIEAKYPLGNRLFHSTEEYALAQKDILEAYSHKECLLKLGNVCYKPLNIVPTDENITYQECVQNNAEYGIKYCKFSPDRFATVAKACGGTKNLPTLKELNALVDYLYGINVEECLKYMDNTTEGYFKYQDCFQKYSEGLNIKEDSDLVNELFLYKYPFLAANGDEQEQMNIIKLILVSGEERSSFYQYGWGIGRHGVYYTADIGRNSDYFTLCVNRD